MNVTRFSGPVYPSASPTRFNGQRPATFQGQPVAAPQFGGEGEGRKSASRFLAALSLVGSVVGGLMWADNASASPAYRADKAVEQEALGWDPDLGNLEHRSQAAQKFGDYLKQLDRPINNEIYSEDGAEYAGNASTPDLQQRFDVQVAALKGQLSGPDAKAVDETIAAKQDALKAILQDAAAIQTGEHAKSVFNKAIDQLFTDKELSSADKAALKQIAGQHVDSEDARVQSENHFAAIGRTTVASSLAGLIIAGGLYGSGIRTEKIAKQRRREAKPLSPTTGPWNE